ncbi:MAG: HD-GYP domain-containing protein [bacterium]
MSAHNNIQAASTIAALMAIGDPEVYAHCFRVAGYAVATARCIKLSSTEVDIIEQAALLHDVGKVTVAGSILNKTTCLTTTEYEKVKFHSEVGQRVVQKTLGLDHVASLVRSHHERYDGQGYPDGLLGEETLLGARIIAVADAFDAMTSNRPYRKSRSVSAAVQELVLLSGTQFDPAVVQAFTEILPKDRELAYSFTEGARSFFDAAFPTAFLFNDLME